MLSNDDSCRPNCLSVWRYFSITGCGVPVYVSSAGSGEPAFRKRIRKECLNR